jgi:aspartate/methionine/tyrosine aminotransferase
MYPDPGFPTYPAMIEVAGGKPVPVPLREEEDFAFDLQAFDDLVSSRTKLVILNSPGNPTGGVMPLHVLEHVASAAQRLGFWVLSDEIYTALPTAPCRPDFTLPGMAERTIICGFSKTYAMTLAVRVWHHAGALAEVVEFADSFGGLHCQLHPNRRAEASAPTATG